MDTRGGHTWWRHHPPVIEDVYTAVPELTATVMSADVVPTGVNSTAVETGPAETFAVVRGSAKASVPIIHKSFPLGFGINGIVPHHGGAGVREMIVDTFRRRRAGSIRVAAVAETS